MKLGFSYKIWPIWYDDDQSKVFDTPSSAMIFSYLQHSTLWINTEDIKNMSKILNMQPLIKKKLENFQRAFYER